MATPGIRARTTPSRCPVPSFSPPNAALMPSDPPVVSVTFDPPGKAKKRVGDAVRTVLGGQGDRWVVAALSRETAIQLCSFPQLGMHTSTAALASMRRSTAAPAALPLGVQT
jgi:hypothetical protein